MKEFKALYGGFHIAVASQNIRSPSSSLDLGYQYSD